MNDNWVKAIATVVFGGGYFGAVWLGLGDITANVFLALLSAVWVLPPVKNALKNIFKA